MQMYRVVPITKRANCASLKYQRLKVFTVKCLSTLTLAM